MTEIADWNAALPNGLHHLFSPSGQALAFQPVLYTPPLQSLEIHFADSRQPIVYEDDSMISPLAWVSDTELVYHKSGLPLGMEVKATLHVFDIENGHSRFLADKQETMSVVWMGSSGHLCIVTELEGRQGLFDLDTHTGVLERITDFDKAFELLKVYPLFGHAWFPQRQELALIAWPYDYLEEGVEPTRMNSHWNPILDEPSIQNSVSIRHDGSQVTQRELSQEAKRKKPFRLFLLNRMGACLEVPGTYKAAHPLWSPDGSLLAFTRYEETGTGLWLLQRSNLSLHRMGDCLRFPDPIMHPSGVLCCQMLNETTPNTREHERERSRSAKWHRFILKNGQASILQQHS